MSKKSSNFAGFFFAGSLLVRVPKLRFSSKYSKDLRSPQELKIVGGPEIKGEKSIK